MEPGTGPVVERPFRSRDDLDRLRPLEPEVDTPYVLETVRNLVDELGDTPLIGFAGAPFTVASYLIEGGPSRTYTCTKALMHGDPDLWRDLIDRLADMAVASLRSQVEAGASAIQLFDSWAGALSPPDYERFVLPASRAVFEGVADLGVPRIHFGVGTGELLAAHARRRRRRGRRRLARPARRGPAPGRARPRRSRATSTRRVLGAPWPVVADQVRDVLRRNGGDPGHVFNLGHGVLPDTDPDVLARVVELVHDRPRDGGASPSGWS